MVPALGRRRACGARGDCREARDRRAPLLLRGPRNARRCVSRPADAQRAAFRLRPRALSAIAGYRRKAAIAAGVRGGAAGPAAGCGVSGRGSADGDFLTAWRLPSMTRGDRAAGGPRRPTGAGRSSEMAIIRRVRRMGLTPPCPTDRTPWARFVGTGLLLAAACVASGPAV